MYSELAISTLSGRLFWNKALDAGFTIALDESNATGTSGKHFQSFHQLVTIDNIYETVLEVAMSEDDFNAVLTDIKMQATLQALTDIIDRNDLSIVDTDYSEIIIKSASLFDNAIGYKAAVNVLEMFMSTNRINLTERNAKLASSNLKLELEGFINENGHVVAKGIRNYYYSAVKSATNKLFPKKIIIQTGNGW